MENDTDDLDYLININEANEAEAVEYIDELIVKLSNGGKKLRILFHVDEHRRMCDRTDEKNDPGADFIIIVLCLQLVPRWKIKRCSP